MSYKEYTVRVHDNGIIHWENEEGQIHREDGPAIEYIGDSKSWYRNGKRHREDGPAVEHADGVEYWYLEGVCLTKEAWKAKMNPVKEMSVQEISELLGFEVKVVK